MFSRSCAWALILATTGAAAAPCDIYAAGNTPCVAAHGTTRALFDGYSGPLYEIKRDSDGHTTPVLPLTTGGVANATAQDDFCAGTTCVISIIYDQSGHNNHLYQAPPNRDNVHGPEEDGYYSLASAIGAPVTLSGHKAYGVFTPTAHGYRNNECNGTAIDDQPEGIYAVLDGTHYNEGCCYDYGNVETSSTDTGNGHMETIYFGAGDKSNNKGEGSGPWIMADLENGLFSGQEPGVNVADPSQSARFLTAIVKGESDHWAIRGGNAASGNLTSYYDGARPRTVVDYNPMHKEGALVLGMGGDNSDSAQGTFYEGAITYGYPSNETEAKVQENIVAAQYKTTDLNTGPKLTVGSQISFRVTTPGFTDRYLSHQGQIIGTDSVQGPGQTWIVRTGLGNSGCYSFESYEVPGAFIRHNNYELHLDAIDGTKLYTEDATFCTQPGLNGQGTSFRAWEIPTRYIRHVNAVGYIARNGGYKDFDVQSGFTDDVSFIIGNGFA